MKRISVTGSSGSGKSTLASKLAERLGAENVELDALYHQPGWTPLPDSEFLSSVAEAISGDRWVVDGNYNVVRELIWDAADTIVWIDLPRRVVMFQLVRRTVGRAVLRKRLWNGNRESLREVISRDPNRSVVVWAWTHFDERRSPFSTAMADTRWSPLDWIVRRAIRRAWRSPRLPSVIIRSAMRRRSFAFASVVSIRSCSSSDVTMLRNSARRCEVDRPSFLPDFRCRIVQASRCSRIFSRSFRIGRFSTVIPRVRPIDASVSLISLRDFRPKFFVLSISDSVRWTNSPMNRMFAF